MIMNKSDSNSTFSRSHEITSYDVIYVEPSFSGYITEENTKIQKYEYSIILRANT